MKTYLICYGADNELWLGDAEDKADAIAQFAAASLDGEINVVYQCDEV